MAPAPPSVPASTCSRKDSEGEVNKALSFSNFCVSSSSASYDFSASDCDYSAPDCSEPEMEMGVEYGEGERREGEGEGGSWDGDSSWRDSEEDQDEVCSLHSSSGNDAFYLSSIQSLAFL